MFGYPISNKTGQIGLSTEISGKILSVDINDVAKTMVSNPRVITINGWYKFLPVMGG